MSSGGLWVAAAGAVAQQTALDATANNIANASTAGYHAERITFKEVLAYAKSPDVALVGTTNTKVDQQAGALTQTGNPLDLALEGDGYFAVETPQGARYTRAGNFQVNADRTLVNIDGHPVRAENGSHITIPPNAAQIAVGADGTVSADGQAVGKIELAVFRPEQLKREGASLMSATGEPERNATLPKVSEGVLESSNVNIVRGVVDLVKISRQYESLMRVIQGFHDIESRAARDIGGPK